MVNYPTRAVRQDRDGRRPPVGSRARRPPWGRNRWCAARQIP